MLKVMSSARYVIRPTCIEPTPELPKRYQVFDDAAGGCIFTFDNENAAQIYIDMIVNDGKEYVVHRDGEMKGPFNTYYECPECKTPGLLHTQVVLAKGGKINMCLSCKQKQKERRKGYQSTKDNHNKQKRQKGAAARKIVAEYLSCHSCIDCGVDNILVLEFDHKPGQKISREHEISRLIHRNATKEEFMEEFAKCEVRCANCHRIKSMVESGSYRVDYMNGLL